MFNLLPDWAFHALLGVSVLIIILSYILKRIPFVSQYNVPLRIIGVLLVILTVWCEGGRDVQHIWAARVKDLETKVATAQEESNKVNVKIQTRVVTKIKEIEKEGKTITEYVDREVVKFNDSCTIPKSVITALNAAATGQPLKDEKASERIQLKLATSLK